MQMPPELLGQMQQQDPEGMQNPQAGMTEEQPSGQMPSGEGMPAEETMMQQDGSDVDMDQEQEQFQDGDEGMHPADDLMAEQMKPTADDAIDDFALMLIDYYTGIRNDNQLGEKAKSDMLVAGAGAITALYQVLPSSRGSDIQIKQQELEMKKEEMAMQMQFKQQEHALNMQVKQEEMQFKQQETQQKLNMQQQSDQLKLQQQQENHQQSLVQGQESHESSMEQQKQAAQLKQTNNSGSKADKS